MHPRRIQLNYYAEKVRVYVKQLKRGKEESEVFWNEKSTFMPLAIIFLFLFLHHGPYFLRITHF